MLSTMDDDFSLPDDFNEMVKLFDGLKLRATVAAMAADMVTVRHAVDTLTTELRALVVTAKVPDFETAGELGRAMMVLVYPSRSLLLRPENPTRKQGSPVYSETNDHQRDIAQWILQGVLSAISCYDADDVVKKYADELWKRIPSPFRVGGKKCWEGVEL
jgi:hypothetical protein